MSQWIISFSDHPDRLDGQTVQEFSKAVVEHTEKCLQKLEGMLEGSVMITARMLYLGYAGIKGSEEACLALKEKVEAAGLGTMNHVQGRARG